MGTKEYNVDFCVVGGGLAGICAAIEAARRGAKVALMHERAVLGGNASSEIRMWVCGADGSGNRETGILEEIALENLYRNPYKLWPVWDSILYEKVRFEKNITLLLNCTCFDAETDGDRIVCITGWQMTTQKRIKVRAKNFADCSGDSILAPLTGAHFSVGREGPDEYGEKMSIEKGDRKTMGSSCLIQARKLDRPVDFIPPAWAKKLTDEDMKHRLPRMESPSENFWYLELGGDRDTIADSEEIRDDLLALAFGVWDYIKNSGKIDAANWQLDFLGFLPGKRESRRMRGKYIMTQTDISSGRRFEDTVAFGGWPLDDHDPAGFWHRGAPCVQIPTPSPYPIPYRCLYSENIENLFFAGRNISMTHAAMSSARVMATCGVLGQAVGAAAALCAKYGCSPDDIYKGHLDELQQNLLYDDARLPGFELRLDPAPDGEKKYVKEARIIFDSDLDRLTLPGDKCERRHSMRANVNTNLPKMCMPATLCRSFAVEAEGKVIFEEENNIRRLVIVPVDMEVTRLTLIPGKSWGGAEAAVVSFSVR